MPTIGLCMIVKNEAALIERCLDSVLPLIDYAVIDDTGSTDGTQDIICSWLDRHQIPGAVSDVPWRDFAHNRSLTLQRLRNRPEIDYAMMFDADDVLVIDPEFDAAAWKASLTADLYDAEFMLGTIRYFRPLMFRNRIGFHYRGVLHEYLEAPPGRRDKAVGLHVQAGVEGERSRSPHKYRNDALLLRAALDSESDPLLRARYTFYMAQSWKDCGEYEQALDAYLARAEMGHWAEEIFISLYRAADLMASRPQHLTTHHPASRIIDTYLRAWEGCPHRAEALHGAASYCRQRGRFELGYLFAKTGIDIPVPDNGLFVEPWIYDYGMLDEFAVNAYWAGHPHECLDACERLLSGVLPEDMRGRIEANAQFARDKL